MASVAGPRVAEASAWFMRELVKLEPGTEDAGIFADKEGYHNTGDANLRRWPGSYSIRDAQDRRGPSWRTKAAAYDWTFPDAQRGDFRRMVKYGQRLRAAYDRRDPRLAGWREALGQTDLDGPPEGLDFRHHFTRVPDDTHRWHWHFSEDREQVEDYRNKRAMLSVLRGEPLSIWLENEGDDVIAADVWAFRFKGVREDKTTFDFSAQDMVIGANAAAWKALAAAETVRAEQNASRAAIEALTEVIRSTGGDLDTAAILARIDAAAATTGAVVEQLRGELEETQTRLAETLTALAAAERERDEQRDARLAKALDPTND